MLNRVRIILVGLFFIPLISCAGQEVIPTLDGSTHPQSSVSQNTRTRAPSHTPTVSHTPTITLTPTITPTPTPPPGLEFFNARYDGLFVIGELRNNTDQTIVMYTSDEKQKIRINFDYYLDRSYSLSDGTHVIEVQHLKWGPVGVFSGIMGMTENFMNCLLYPGEVGTLFTPWNGMPPRLPEFDNKIEVLRTMPPQLGLFYTYESSYVADPAIPKNFHPKAENVTFRLEGGYIHFEFDVNMPYAEMVDIAKQRVDIPAWIKVYDAQGRLQSILHKELRNLLYVEFGKKVHIEGYSALSVYPTPEESSDIERFWLTYGIMEAADTTTVDHIAVNIEFRWDPEVLHSPCIEAYESLRRG